MGHDYLDHGSQPFFLNITTAAQENPDFRTALWTGMHLQMTLMHLPTRGEVGPEVYPDTDQLIRVEAGCAIVRLGMDRDRLNRHFRLCEGDAIFIPCGTWHNLTNVGTGALKLSVLCTPQCNHKVNL